MTMGKQGINLIVVLFIFILTLSGFASAKIIGSIGSGKMVLSKEFYPQLWELNGKDTVTIEKYVIVKNVNDFPVNITLKLDEGAAEFIELVDETFILQPNTQENADFIVRVKEPGTYEGQIAILFKEVDGKSGVALPSSITVIAKEAGSYEQPDEEIEDINDTGTTPTTGGVSGVNEGTKPDIGTIIMISSSVLLIVVLVFLVFLMKKSTSKRRNGRNGKK